MKTTPVLSGSYDAIAKDYAAWVREGKLIHSFVIPHLLEILGPLSGQRMLDLACGEGIMARTLAEAGAHTLGIDLSLRLLDLARQAEAEHPLGITYLQDDAHTLAQLAPTSFDAVCCNMALTDLADLSRVGQAVARVLRPGGIFVFSMPHPCFQTAPGAVWGEHPSGTVQAQVTGYFAEGPRQTRWSRGLIVTHHRTLSSILTRFAASGLLLTNLAEPQAPATFRRGYDQVPGVLICRLEKLLEVTQEEDDV